MQTKAIAEKSARHRFCEFDLLKAISVLGLPVVHLIEETIFANYATEGVMRFELWIVGLVIIGPSVFMICMGFGIGGTRTSAQSCLKQGVRFIVLGLLLNLVRWVLPGFIHYVVNGDSIMNEIELFLMSDIYLFVGLFYIFYSVMLRLKVSTYGLILISLIMLSVNTLLTPIMGKYLTDSLLSAFLGNFVYVDKFSCFPLMSWAIFPSAGILLGEVLKKTDGARRDLITKRMMTLSAVSFISFAVFLWFYGIDIKAVLISPLNDYVTDLPNAVMMMSLALFWFGVCHFLCKRIADSRFMAFMTKISNSIVPFYLLQWIFVAWIVYGMHIFRAPTGSFGVPIFLVSSLAVTAVCVFISLKFGMKIMRVVLKITSFRRPKKLK